MAKAMANPFDRQFTDHERRVAGLMAQSLEPRVLRHALKHKTNFLVAEGDANDGRDLLHCKSVGGFYSYSEHLIAAFSPLTICNYPEVHLRNRGEMGRILRHECAHQLDFTRGRTFAEYYNNTLEKMISSDRYIFDNYEQACRKAYDYYSQCQENNPLITPLLAARRQTMRNSLKLLCLHRPWAKNPALEPKNNEEMIDQLLMHREDLFRIGKRLESCMPRDPNKPDPHYPTKQKQYNEIAAVVDELSACYGKELMRGLLPNLYKAVREHRLRHPGLYDRANASSAR